MVTFVFPMSAASSFTGRIVAVGLRAPGAPEAHARLPTIGYRERMSEARAKLYINTGVVTAKSDIYNILRPLLKQTVSYTYYRGTRVLSSGTGWVERIVVDHPDIASYFTPLAICVNLDSFDYLQFDTTSDQLLVYTLTIGNERVILEFSAGAAQRLADLTDGDAAPTGGSRPLPRNAEELARDLRFIQMELLMSADTEQSEGERPDEDEDGA
jgi:hypothetical protein